MRVLQVLNDFFPDKGGVQRVVLEISRALAHRGLDVTIVSGTDSPSPDARVVDGVSVVYAGHLFRVGQANISLRMLWETARIETDIIHIHLPSPWSVDSAALIGKLRGLPVVLTYHNDIVGSGWMGPAAAAYRNSMLRLTLALVDHIVVTTSHRLSVSPLLRRFSEKVDHIPFGIDSERFRDSSSSTDGRTIGFLALLRDTHRYKGLDVLLRAVQVLCSRGVAVRLKVGGEGNLLSHYRQLASELGLLEKVEFLGLVAEERLVQFYNSLDVFVLPSLDERFEGFGLVALEAVACGRPVVTTTAAGVGPTMAQNGCGLVVPPGDHNALADAIEKLLKDAGLRTELGLRGKSLAKRLSWDRVAETYHHIYRNLVLGRTGAASPCDGPDRR